MHSKIAMMPTATGLEISYNDAMSPLVTFSHILPIPSHTLDKQKKGFVRNSAVTTDNTKDLMLSAVGNWRTL